jgi:5'-3' exonuclease
MKLAQPTLPPASTCIVDLTGFLHRLAYMPGPRGMNPRMVTSRNTGEPTWGIVGAFNQLNTLAKLKPARIIAFSDSSQNGFRQAMLDTYKQKSGSTYIGQQLARLAQCLPLMGIPVIGAKEEFPGMEAEDLISKAALVLDGNVVIVAYDKDMLQLVGQPPKDQPNSDVYYYHPQKKVLLNRQNLASHIRADYKFPTQAELSGPDFAVLLAVTGDDQDGVKPIGGIGEVTLARYYDKLPTGLSNIDKITALAQIDQEVKAAENKVVIADWKRAAVNLEVTDLRTSRQLGLALNNDMPNPQPDKAAFKAVLEELTMGAFLNQYDNWFAPFEALAGPQPEVTPAVEMAI